MIRCAKCKEKVEFKSYKRVKRPPIIRGKIVCQRCFYELRVDNFKRMNKKIDIPTDLRLLEEERIIKRRKRIGLGWLE